MFSPFPHEYLGHWVNGAGMGGLFPSILNVIFLAIDPDPKVRMLKYIHIVETNSNSFSKNSVAKFWLTNFHYFLQLIFRLTPLTSAVKSNEKLVNKKLCNTVLILDAL